MNVRGEIAGESLIERGVRGGVDGFLHERDELRCDAAELHVGNADVGVGDAELEGTRGMDEGGLDGFVGDLRGDDFGGECLGERGGDEVDGGAAVRQVAGEERKLGVDGGVDFRGREPDEVLKAYMQHAGAGGGFEVEGGDDIGDGTAERGSDVFEVAGVCEALGCGAEGVGGDGRAGMELGCGFKLRLREGAGVLEDEVLDGVGLRCESGREEEGKDRDELHSASC